MKINFYMKSSWVGNVNLEVISIQPGKEIGELDVRLEFINKEDTED